MSAVDSRCSSYFSDAPQDAQLSLVHLEALPRHLAVIMDGNGRWAVQRGKKRSAGHKAGIAGLRELIISCVRLGIPYLSVYAFSTENWARSKEEVDTLMYLFAKTVVSEVHLLLEEGVRLQLLGDIENLPAKTRQALVTASEQTAQGERMVLGLAINYGSRAEMLHVMRHIASSVQSGDIKLEEIDETLVDNLLYTAGMPDPDLLIRTSGEARISNFMLWQIAYAELYVTPVLWPDFTRFDLLRALINYQARSRRFGGVLSE